VDHRAVVGNYAKEMLLDVVPVFVKDVMGLPASVKKINAFVTRDAVLQKHKKNSINYFMITMN